MKNPLILVLNTADGLCDQVERAVRAMRPRPEVVRCHDPDELYQRFDEDRPVDVLIAGPSAGTEAGLVGLRALRTQVPEFSLILAFDRWRGSSLRDTVRAGAVDILRLPVEDKDIADAVGQALKVRPAKEPEAPAVVDSEPTAPGEVIAVLSASGGCGKTFLAANLAYYLHSRSQKRTCLLDLDLQFGELSTALRLKPRHTITDLLAGDGGEGDDLAPRLVEHLVIHDTGIHLLAAPATPSEADAIDATHIARVIAAARSLFDYVILDTPPSLGDAVLTALEQTDHLFAMATLDLPSVRNLGVLLKTLEQLNFPAERIKLVLNKVEHDVGIEVEEVKRYFPQGFSMVVPYGREANRSLNMGVPLLAFAPRSEVGRALRDGILASLPVEGARGATDETGTRGRIGWRRKRSA